ncbi:hypothetical protein HPB49_002821 [Dermacentor silvarum]|uniref:Uncharacterized protein n=1 Tax=Dermacentor silvarum TaxID=543639 RepID=A0ACB8CP40_DERSI|nr:hypothetical protein HPB49_002821 [Dermacentor silvarum]
MASGNSAYCSELLRQVRLLRESRRVRERLNVECTADDFCMADDNLATCGACMVEDIVKEATCKTADSSNDGDDIDVGDGKGPPPATKTLHALNVLRCAMAANEISDMCTRFYGFEQSLLSDPTKKKK